MPFSYWNDKTLFIHFHITFATFFSNIFSKYKTTTPRNNTFVNCNISASFNNTLISICYWWFSVVQVIIAEMSDLISLLLILSLVYIVFYDQNNLLSGFRLYPWPWVFQKIFLSYRMFQVVIFAYDFSCFIFIVDLRMISITICFLLVLTG